MPTEIYRRKKPVFEGGTVIGWQYSTGYSDGAEKPTHYIKRG